LVWTLNGEAHLSQAANDLIQQEADGNGVLVPAIAIWEIALLVRKGRLDLGQEIGRWVEAALALPGIRLEPLHPVIALDSNALPGAFHKDPADRIITATARYHGVPLVTVDQAILDYGAQGHVRVIDASL
jgi:PIN domain nuclease of toxin-antitoxin system